jgi:hypothetical protein
VLVTLAVVNVGSRNADLRPILVMLLQTKGRVLRRNSFRLRV